MEKNKYEGNFNFQKAPGSETGKVIRPRHWTRLM